MVKNKKGFLQIIEATFAIMIVTGAIFFVLAKQGANSEQEDFYGLLRPILNEIAKNETLRNKIITDTDSSNDAETEIINFLSLRIQNPKLNYNATICNADPNVQCGNAASFPSNSGKEIYSEERIITATQTQFTPKIVKLYLWKK